MSDGEEKNEDLYAVLGLEKECTDSELRNAYKKLALRWHPDRCVASGNLKFVEEAKTKFQEIQQAYSVLSDANKRFLYDVGAYDNDDDESNNGMGDFLKEMAVMMSQTKPNETGGESFENLQDLFNEMFQGDIKGFGISTGTMETTACSASSYVSYVENSVSNKRNLSQMNAGSGKSFSCFDSYFQNAHLEAKQWQETEKDKEVGGGSYGDGSSRRRQGRKQKVASGHDVSSNSYSGVSA